MRIIILGLIAWLLCALAPARAQTTVKLLGTFPEGSDIAVPTGETVYVRVAYDAPKPTRIWVRPYYQGKDVSAGSGPSPLYQGKGELLGFFFLTRPGHVDALRVTAGDGSVGGTTEIARWPIRVSSYSNAPPVPPAPAWLGRLREAHDKAMREQVQSRAGTGGPPGALATGFVGVFMLAFVALGIVGLAWPAWAVWRWRGKWRGLAMAPLAVLGFVVLRIVIGIAMDPTSHNLWPFEIILFGGASVLAMAAIAAMRWWERRRDGGV